MNINKIKGNLKESADNNNKTDQKCNPKEFDSKTEKEPYNMADSNISYLSKTNLFESGLTREEADEIRKYLDEYKRPMFFFHDDPDGVCSFLLMLRYAGDGRGVILKNTPEVSTQYLRKVREFEPDIIFVLDLANIEQEFLDSVKVPVIWIDHHGPFRRDRVKYFNPRLRDSHEPVSYLCYQVVQQDLWLSMVGCVGDWFLPVTQKEFSKDYPDLLQDSVNRPEDALFSSRLGELVHIFSMILKGSVGEVFKYISAMKKIHSPYEILEKQTNEGRYIQKRFERINKDYDSLLGQVKSTRSRYLVFLYKDDKTSFTKEISNYLLYKYPKKIIIIGREKDGQLKMSLRSTDLIIPPVLNEVFKKVNGRGGGHEHACGAVIDVDDKDMFLKLFKQYSKTI
ncbi:hypothetical protein K9M79_00375 [Candidatus Woesearchaeota archaeon]|nr:hypothetical protein [Candidatus Woesearchaeota archaeon]